MRSQRVGDDLVTEQQQPTRNRLIQNLNPKPVSICKWFLYFFLHLPTFFEEIPHVQGRRRPSTMVPAGVVAVQCWSDFKEIPHVHGQRRSPRKMVGRENLHLESNPISASVTERAHTDLVCTRTQRPHRDWDKTVFIHRRVEVRVSSGLLQGHGLWVQQTWVGMSPLGGGGHYPHHRAARTYPGLRNRLLEGTDKHVCTRT